MLQGSWSSSPPKIPICPGTLCPERKVNHGVALQPGLAPLTDDRSKTDLNNKHLHHIFTHIIYGGHLWTSACSRTCECFSMVDYVDSMVRICSCGAAMSCAGRGLTWTAPRRRRVQRFSNLSPFIRCFDAVYFDAGVSESAEQLER